MFLIDVPALSPAEAAARWLALGPVMPEDGRPEMDQYGELILSPLPGNRHQRIAGQIAHQLQAQLGGLGWTGLAINTRIGVRVPDACWSATPERFDADPAPMAPEVCVEVASPSNTRKWLLEKVAAYLEAGATEAVIVETDGSVHYYDADGERTSSRLGLTLSATA